MLNILVQKLHFPLQNIGRKIRKNIFLFLIFIPLEAGDPPASTEPSLVKIFHRLLIFRSMFCWGKCPFQNQRYFGIVTLECSIWHLWSSETLRWIFSRPARTGVVYPIHKSRESLSGTCVPQTETIKNRVVRVHTHMMYTVSHRWCTWNVRRLGECKGTLLATLSSTDLRVTFQVWTRGY